MENQQYNGYETLSITDLPDIHSVGTVLRHRKSGARVILVSNDDDNKVFSIAFRTPPADSTGVAHILEHSVLCGSREFPVKDPFVELVKGSLNTFLNAITYPDKTVYPVASCNDKDFQNLMHVYLDAVFYPNIYSKEEIFRQEGWNYHLEDPEGPLTLNGVVYNEMKGAFSSSDEVLDREIMNSLFPDTPYGVESGGDPEYIPELTYEAFLDFHRKYYHPSNSYIYLYGNMDMAEKLAFIDSHYLSNFDCIGVDSEIAKQKPFDAAREIVKEYPVSEDEEDDDNTYLTCNIGLGTIEDSAVCTAFEVLDYALLSAPGAPLRKALLEAGIGKDIYGSFDDGIMEPYFKIVAKGSTPDKKDEFLRIIHDTLQEIVDRGIDQKAVNAGINMMEFQYREADFSNYPKGLFYGLDIMDSWLYSDAHPFCNVQLLPVFRFLKEQAGQGYFEDLIRKYLLENTYRSVLTLVPKKGLQAEREEALAEKLETYLQSLSDEERQRMVERTAALEAWQEEKDLPENMEKIPMLSRSDIKKEVRPFANEERELDGSLFLYHDVVTNGIGYLDLMFEIDRMDPDRIHDLGLLKACLGYMDTSVHDYGALANEINGSTGGLLFGLETFENEAYEDGFRTMFSIVGKALYPQMQVLFDLVKEIVYSTRFEDTARLKEIVSEIASRAKESMVSGGHGTAVLRASSYSSVEGAYQDELSGIGFLEFIQDLEAHFEERKEDLGTRLSHLASEIFCRDNFRVSYTGERESLEKTEALLKEFRNSLPHKPETKTGRDLKYTRKNEGLHTSGQVQYVAQTGNFLKHGFDYTGALDILKVILNYDYLWSCLRVKGGAYGCMSGFKRNGEAYFVSYRDPHLRRTLDIYKGIPAYLRSFDVDEREMTKYIIGAISAKDMPLTPKMQGIRSKNAWFSGLTAEMLMKYRSQIVDAVPEDIRALADLTEAVLSDQNICVVGSESKVKAAAEILSEIRPIGEKR